MRPALIFFLKLPAPGQVKTRLARKYGDAAALRLYEAFVADMLATLGRLVPSRAELFVCAAPACRIDDCFPWLVSLAAPQPPPPCRILPQRGADLGERMRNAFLDAFACGASQTLLLGADLPDLPHEHLLHALDALRVYHVVLGPTLDGGYCCLGQKPETFTPEIFERIEWSSPLVLAQSRERLRAADRSVKLLPTWRDIDEPEDLLAFCERQQKRITAPASFAAARVVLESLAPAPDFTS